MSPPKRQHERGVDVLNRHLESVPLVAILRGVTSDTVLDIAQVLFDAGFRCIEIPLNSPHPLRSIRLLADRFGEQILLGAGTVLDAGAIGEVAAAGGRLIVMPHTDPALIRRAVAAELCCVPGVATPSEAFAALSAGAHALKMFPAEAMPPGVVKAWCAVLPGGVRLLPVGGIGAADMSGYLAAGAGGFGLGSALYRPGMSAQDVAVNARAFRDALAKPG